MPAHWFADFGLLRGLRSMRLIRDFWKDRSGATAIEYGLLAALISVGIIAGIGAIGNNLQNVFLAVANKVG
jgi:pilus assembly protein Flp/PilA